MPKEQDLTRGRPAATLLAFYFPLLLTNFCQQMYAFCDALVVGRGLGDAALAAVGNLAPLTLVIVGFCTGLTGGFAVPIAQRYGAKDMPALRRGVAAATRLCALLCAALTAAGLLLLPAALRALRTAEAIMGDSLRYGAILLAGLPVTMAYNLFSCLLRALGDSKTPLQAILVSSAVNIAADCACILALGWGVGSAAAATVAAQAAAALLCLRRLRGMRDLRLSRADFARDARAAAELLHNGLPAALMNSVTGVGDGIVQGAINALGVAYTSAYAMCVRVLNLAMLPSLTASFALSAFAGQNAGAKQPSRIREGVKTGFLLTAAFAALAGAALIPLGWMFALRGAVQGLGRPLVPMASGLLEMAVRIGVIAALLPRLGFGVAAAANVVAWLGALALNAASYARWLRAGER